MARRGLISPFDWVWDNVQLTTVPNPEPHELAEFVVECVEALESPYRELIEMRYWQRLKYREIAEIMEYESRGNAKHHTVQAEKKLKEMMNDRFNQWHQDYKRRR